MKLLVNLLLILLLLLPSAAIAKTFGAAITVDKVTPISTIIDNPEQYVGKRVKVTGLVIDVCSKRGCWIYLAGDRDFEKLRIKVTDGEIVFPMEARGKIAVVEGIVEKFELSREEVVARRQHHAEEKGVSFDPASVTSGETVLRVRGLGADIPEL